MSNPTDSVSISILDRDYQFTCSPEERDALRAAALHLDDKMREVKSAGNLIALERIAVTFEQEAGHFCFAPYGI